MLVNLVFKRFFNMNMKLKSSITFAMLTLLSLTACDNSNKSNTDQSSATQQATQEEANTQAVEQPVIDSTDDAVADPIDDGQQPEVTVTDGVGVLPQSAYSGVLPCADCSGIQTDLTLNADGTFVMAQEYLGKPDGQITTKGTYDINGLDSRYVLLHPEDQSDIPPYLIYMDKDSVQFRDIENGEEPSPDHTLNLVS